MSTVATTCTLTVHDGAPTLRLRGDGLDVLYPLTPSEAAALTARLARTLSEFHRPRHDRTGESLAHPDNHVLRERLQPMDDPDRTQPLEAT